MTFTLSPDYEYKLNQDNTNDNINKRLLNSIYRNDISFLMKNSPPVIDKAEDLVEASLYMNLDNSTIIWIINKYHCIMDMNKIFDQIISYGKIKIAKELYEKNVGIWSFDAVCTS